MEIFNCLQNLETEMKNIKEISLAAKYWLIKGAEQFEEFEKDLKKKEEKIN